MLNFQRCIQLLMLALFFVLLLLTASPLPQALPLNAFFQMDPLLFLGVWFSTGTLMPGIAVILTIVFFTLLIGRFFCGYICPLGTTLDLTQPLFYKSGKKSVSPDYPKLRRVKYLFLLLLLLAALMGLNLFHWGSPLSLAGRMYTIIVLPLLNFLLFPAIDLLVPGLKDASLLSFVSRDYQYNSLLFFLAFFTLILGLNSLTPRFWCRYLCPSGAIFSLLGKKPLLRRRVSEQCIDCGKCISQCPMQAIPGEPRNTFHAECISCRKCFRVCPTRAIDFSLPHTPDKADTFLPGRRETLQVALAGVFVVFAGKRGLNEYWPLEEKGQITPSVLVRPPGALPEIEFKNQCTRCGLCFQVCPTNMLQPVLLQDGISGMFTPVANSRRGPCETHCNACGQVCPTGAIRDIPLSEKKHAKMGTAVLYRHKCLAWEFDEPCLICDEACPFGAIDLKRTEKNEVAVPFVSEDKCLGCGYCEHACPVRAEAAIRVSPMGEIRLASGSYRQRARQLKLKIGEEEKKGKEKPDTGLPPGFTQ
ncbi:MAG: 4Fe-4S binding protein [Thermodesulfobacteriota bacterium]